MNLHVKYENPVTREYDQYDTTMDALIDSFNGVIEREYVIDQIRAADIATVTNGHATTTVTVASHNPRPDCDCIECTEMIDWDAPCPECIGSAEGRPQRDCCGCHDDTGDHYADCEHYGIED